MAGPEPQANGGSASADLAAPNGPAMKRAPKKQLTALPSLSHIDPSLLIGTKDVASLKALSRQGGAVNGQGTGGTHPPIAVRADLVDLADIDSALDRAKRSQRQSERFQELPEVEEGKELADWEIDLRKLMLKNQIAKGTFGTVYRGTYNGRDVAVKLLDWGEEDTTSRAHLSALRTAFAQEVSVWSTLSHPNVTEFIGGSLGNQDGFSIPSLIAGSKGEYQVKGNMCCVVVEYMAGGTLKDYLIAHYRKKLPFKTVLRLSLDLARGLEYLHAKRIVHRDMKTENLLMDGKKTVVKITDFGVARLEAVDPQEMTGRTGTLGYMAPEVLDGRPYNHKADIYSLGICLWEIYVCDMPFPNLDIKAMAAVVNQGMRPHIPRICPKQFADIMMACWDSQPTKRPSMRDVVKMLEAIDPSKGQSMVALDELPKHSKGCFCF